MSHSRHSLPSQENKKLISIAIGCFVFRWQKKLEKEGLENLKDDELDQLAQKRIMEQKMELEKVKRARLERERERQERLELEELENRYQLFPSCKLSQSALKF